MKAYPPPTCDRCGSVLSGFARSEELDFPVYFCPRCRGPEAVRPLDRLAPPAAGVIPQEEAALPEAA